MFFKFLFFLLFIEQLFILMYLRLEFNSMRENFKVGFSYISKNCSDLISQYVIRFSKKG